ncbi:MAG: terpene cyclase/mutase family protein [Gemmataceae bacterium]|nr:terpene cyclase/mutase family protein [Gemmataceae bacterium]MCI0738208.1 terpene cyclase/mutase family protein [Gemmataceae bacterium]
MKTPSRFFLVVVGSLIASTLQSSQLCAQSTWSAKEAAKYLDERADWWLNWSTSARGQGTACISCHTAVPYALARPALGEQLDEKAAGATEKRLVDNVKKRVDNWDAIVSEKVSTVDPFVPFYAGSRKSSSHGTESVLNALVLVNHDSRRTKGALTPQAEKALDHLWGQQKENGAWLWLDFGLRPWETDGEYYGAALAALTVGMAGPVHYKQATVQPKVAALKSYLREAFPGQSLHNRTMALWASSRLPDALTAEHKKKLIDELLTIQESDGGWRLPSLGKIATENQWKSHGAYPPGTESDGYATGLVVLALQRAGVAADDAKLKKGIDWLGKSQLDGSWPVHYVNKSRNPQSDVGKFMRDAATAYAVLVLAESK